MTPRARARLTAGLGRVLVEFGPLLVFFVAQRLDGVFAGTAWFMAATAVAIVASAVVERRLPIVPLFGLAMVLAFGALTLVYRNELFILIRPTVVNLVFGLALAGGLAADRLFLKAIAGPSLALDDAGWRILTRRLILFFLLLALLNEVVWRSFSIDTWVAFKVFVLLPLNGLFALAQWPLLKRHDAGAPDRRPDAGDQATAPGTGRRRRPPVTRSRNE